jgi:hypothetical protein
LEITRGEEFAQPYAPWADEKAFLEFISRTAGRMLRQASWVHDPIETARDLTMEVATRIDFSRLPVADRKFYVTRCAFNAARKEMRRAHNKSDCRATEDFDQVAAPEQGVLDHTVAWVRPCIVQIANALTSPSREIAHWYLDAMTRGEEELTSELLAKGLHTIILGGEPLDQLGWNELQLRVRITRLRKRLVARLAKEWEMTLD